MPYAPTVNTLNVIERGGFVDLEGWVDVLQLSANTPASYNLGAVRTNMGLPAGAPLAVVFQADGPFYMNPYGTAAVPSSSTTNGAASLYSPNQRFINGIANDGSAINTLSFVAAATTNVTMSFYKPG